VCRAQLGARIIIMLAQFASPSGISKFRYLPSLCAHVPLCWKGVEVDSRSSVHCHGCLAVQFQAATTPVGTGWVMRGASRGRGAQRRRHNSPSHRGEYETRRRIMYSVPINQLKHIRQKTSQSTYLPSLPKFLTWYVLPCVANWTASVCSNPMRQPTLSQTMRPRCRHAMPCHNLVLRTRVGLNRPP